ncbi:MAG: hormogonium polysaccharide biosynthesis protein HpsA [Nostoc sp.]|uniref:hormogonium polysaccharide biosynthesis protein HpsA n=1 Tax=Nostoc sp. TaxID=1180 RepID=UPI002FF5A9D7
MSRKFQLLKAIQKTFKQIRKQFISAINKQIIWLLRTFFGTRRRRGSENAGFLLPTVAMVLIVVVLLTAAILFRSFERSKNASNVRVNEAVLNAAAPALDRARAKLNKLFSDGQLPRAVPSDAVLESTLSLSTNSSTNLIEYTLGDETPLKLHYNYTTLPTGETSQPADLTTAWMFPVDTNNNGKFDSYTLYGIYFRTPPITSGTYSRPRNPLEARTPPMTAGSVSSACKNNLGTSATLVGSTGWVSIASQLQKSFFVYTANVPITNANLPTGTNAANYEAFVGNKGFSGLEYEQDRVQLPLVNNAVVYNDDIELTPGVQFNLNGRILTNSNLLTASNSNIRLFQVSSQNSCFYSEENAKIVVGGNLGAGGFVATSDLNNATTVDLFQGQGANTIQNGGTKSDKSVTDQPNNIAYNSLAYAQRINLLVQAQTSNAASTDPQEVQDAITQQLQLLNLTTATASAAQQSTVRNNQLVLYFQDRTRRVPYGEVGFGANAVGTYNTTTNKPIQPTTGGESLRPPDTWVYPFATSDGKTATNYSNLTLNPTITSTNILPKATQPATQQILGKEQYLGDRILLGNNLPALWWNGTTFVGSDTTTDTQNITNVNWDNGSGTRTRSSRVQQLADLGTVDRDGDWESTAAKVPSTPSDPVGGLRVVTGAGIYLPPGFTVSSTQAALNTAAAATNRIWSDMMPIPNTIASGINPDTYKTNIVLPDTTNTPYLRMRATAVYHYQKSGYSATSPTPIACISSFYDPTNITTAKNLSTLPYNGNAGGNSHNGIVYAAPTKGVSDYSALLNYQANLMYPNGRLVNPTLNTAMGLVAASGTLTISQQSAIDASICAIQILDGTIGSPSTSVIPHGAISEIAFLDARQIKAIHKDVQIDGSGNIIPGRETFTNADGVNGNGTGTSTLCYFQYTCTINADGTVANVPNPSTSSSDADYKLAKETRQPLEIRTTVLDISKLRATTYGTATPQEYLIPNSGIIYATRDDALPDLSYPAGITSTDTATQKQTKQDTQKSQSPVDYKLDPTRRPNAIMLINGNPLWRVQAYRDAEKGLILASNLPVYILGDFNKHTQQEFITLLASDWSNFYSRGGTQSDFNPNFACRTGDSRLPNCTTGDAWRPASVLSDAITLLSNNYKTGYRSDGDYDLNNNLGDNASITAFQNNGLANNANVVNAAWYDTANSDWPLSTANSSYLNNLVTPIQRRINDTSNLKPEYLMEVCQKLPVSACNPATDWWVALPGDVIAYPLGLRASDVTGTAGTPDTRQTFSLTTHLAGTTAQSPTNPKYLSYPRRVAFLRGTLTKPVTRGAPPTTYTSGELALDSSNQPTIIGIQGGKITSFPVSGFSSSSPDPKANALWFKSGNSLTSPPTFLTTISTTNTTAQPILSPVLQINVAFSTTDEGAAPSGSNNLIGPSNTQDSFWLQKATATTFNLVAAGGDTPARPTEDNGGLHNFVRLLENWNPTGGLSDAIAATISGSFIQRTRSAYATAPFYAFLNNSSSVVYPIANSGGLVPFYLAPNRQWGYDVALLSQSPDAFSQKLAITPNNKPNEYFREVGRDDVWMQTLLCAKKASDSGYILDETQRNTALCPSPPPSP